MRVVHLEPFENCIEVDEQRYLVVRDSTGVCHAISDKCAHKGGPLHLGHLDDSRAVIVCPWHKSKTRVVDLVAKGLPTVRAGDRVSVVLGPETSEAPHALRRTLLVELGVALTDAARRQGGPAR